MKNKRQLPDFIVKQLPSNFGQQFGQQFGQKKSKADNQSFSEAA